ncbi:hypothetical protein [Gallibacterium salpingitidis]|uniref:Uncharacterized protein n=1 Tax=Gallibacterium salpingitidis TaxID=505341 RepID=A0A1A7P0C3_9PAST|nr:hypothetical protein [Gallibacterium salpingitidis]OBW95201.1 hypothetical protein QS62_04230 [Gallibacterium salpingitidis]
MTWTIKKGRPYKYNPQILTKRLRATIDYYLTQRPPIYQLVQVGNQTKVLGGEFPTLSEFLVVNNISASAFYRLLKVNPDLADCYEIFRTLQVSRITKIGLCSISPKISKMCIFLLKMHYKRQQKSIYRERQYQSIINELNRILQQGIILPQQEDKAA